MRGGSGGKWRGRGEEGMGGGEEERGGRDEGRGVEKISKVRPAYLKFTGR